MTAHLGKGTWGLGIGYGYPLAGYGFALATITPVSQTAYFCYIGHAAEAITPKRVSLWQLVATGVTITTCEIGVFSTPTAPIYNTGQTLTKIASASWSGVGTGLKSNTVLMATAITPPAHLWAGVRIHTSGTPGVFHAVSQVWRSGYALITTSAGGFAVTGSFAGTIVAPAAIAGEAPSLRLSMD